MAKIKVLFYSQLSDLTGKKELQIEAGNLKQVFEALSKIFNPDFRDYLFDPGNKVKRIFSVMVNTRHIVPKKSGKTMLKDGDTVHLIPPIVGG